MRAVMKVGWMVKGRSVRLPRPKLTRIPVPSELCSVA